MGLVRPSLPRRAQAARRDLNTAQPHAWFAAYVAFAADIRREVRADMRSFDQAQGWRGCAHRVLLRNPYADIGITTWQGIATLWIAERDDPAYRLRCEWTDISGDARAWLTEIAPRFDAIATRLGCVPDLGAPTVPNRWLEAA